MKQSQFLALFVLILIKIDLCNSFQRSSRLVKISGKTGKVLHQDSTKNIINSESRSHRFTNKNGRKQLKRLSNPIDENLRFSEKSARYINPFRKMDLMQTFNDNAYEGWLTVKSEFLGMSEKYPNIPGILEPSSKLPLDNDNNLLNMLWKKDSKEVPSKYFLWARLRGKYVYFSNNKETINILLAIHFNRISGVHNLNNEDFCLNLYEGDKIWTLCSESEEKIEKWTCYFNATLTSTDLKSQCDSPKPAPPLTQIIERKIEQPFIVIPIPQQYCNARWDYEESGNNWQCLCKDGIEQSPIDLPPPHKAVISEAKPIFEYISVGPKHSEDARDGKIRANTSMRIEHIKGALRIYHANFGKVVTTDGTVYIGEEIVFHTPSEHTINGTKYPMEMQVIHKALSKGDYGKQLILSILFKPKAGAINKFIESLDFFNLPNPHTLTRQLFEKLYVPNVFIYSNSDSSSISALQPFSFYTYQGSLTAPPCAEKVIHMVVSDPIFISTTALEMFKEALRQPDFQDNLGNILYAQPSNLENARATQPLNGRAVFYYDHGEHGPLSSINMLSDSSYSQDKGHYEKQVNEATEYYFVEGNKPSGLPGSIVVSDEEANK